MNATLVDRHGACVDGDHWLGEVDHRDNRALSLVRAPVLDVGCGPGRHTIALAERGIMTLGIDITPAALRVARRRGATVLERCVFDRVPGAGRWSTALLLDGNVGIGGDPEALLRRIRELLRPGGRIIVEFAAAHTDGEALRGGGSAQLLCEGEAGPWFAWAEVHADSAAALAGACDLVLCEAWVDTDRSFALLERP